MEYIYYFRAVPPAHDKSAKVYEFYTDDVFMVSKQAESWTIVGWHVTVKHMLGRWQETYDSKG